MERAPAGESGDLSAIPGLIPKGVTALSIKHGDWMEVALRVQLQGSEMLTAVLRKVKKQHHGEVGWGWGPEDARSRLQGTRHGRPSLEVKEESKRLPLGITLKYLWQLES